jgi:hypothetical protein
MCSQTPTYVGFPTTMLDNRDDKALIGSWTTKLNLYSRNSRAEASEIIQPPGQGSECVIG